MPVYYVLIIIHTLLAYIASTCFNGVFTPGATCYDVQSCSDFDAASCPAGSVKVTGFTECNGPTCST